MKKLFFLILFVPLIGFGQNKSFELGAVFGGSLNSLNSNSSIYNKETIRPIGGLLVQYNFTQRFSIMTKLLYHIKGGSLDTSLPDNYGNLHEQINISSDLHYVVVPLLAQINFNKDRWRFFGNTGVYLGYLIKAKNVYEEEKLLGGINISGIEQSLDSFNKFDFGVSLGLGASVQANEKIRITLETSFDHGLTNVLKKDLNSKSIVTSIGVTYNFPIKKKVFNGTSKLECADHDQAIEIDDKKKSKWRLVLYKDGKKIGGKTKRGKSKLFKKKK